MSKDYEATTEAAPEAPTSDHQTVNIKGHNVNPPPPSPHSNQQGEQAEGKGTWRPVLPAPDIPDQHAHDGSHAQHRFVSSGSHGKGGKGRNKGKSKEGKSQDQWRPKGTGKSTGSGKGYDQDYGWGSKCMGLTSERGTYSLFL